MKQLLGHLHGDAPTVDGRTLAEHAAAAPRPGRRGGRAVEQPFKPGGALRVLRGNLAPDGAVVKLAGHERPVHRGPARVFDSEAACKAAVYDGVVQPGEVVVLRNEGPAGAPGMPEMLSITVGDRRPRARRLGRARHRRPVQRRDARVDGRPCRARGRARRADRRRARRRRDHDRRRRAPARRRADDEELAARLADWRPPEPRVTRGVLAKYARSVSSASRGAVTQ